MTWNSRRNGWRICAFIVCVLLSAPMASPADSSDDSSGISAEEKARLQELPKHTELEAQFNQLKAAVMAQGDNIDPKLLERLNGLEAQLESLKSSPAASLPETCLVLSARRTGIKKKSTREALKQLSEWDQQPEAQELSELLCLLAVCLHEFTQEKQKLERQVSLASLLPEIVQKANSTDCRGYAEGIDESVWLELKAIAIEMLSELEKVDDAGFFSMLRRNAWKLAMIPGTAAIFFLRGYRMWREESKKKQEKKEKEASKEAKKDTKKQK